MLALSVILLVAVGAGLWTYFYARISPPSPYRVKAEARAAARRVMSGANRQTPRHA